MLSEDLEMAIMTFEGIERLKPKADHELLAEGLTTKLFKAMAQYYDDGMPEDVLLKWVERILAAGREQGRIEKSFTCEEEVRIRADVIDKLVEWLQNDTSIDAIWWDTDQRTRFMIAAEIEKRGK
jgi:hypothetical protein